MPYGIFELFGVIADYVGNTLLASEKLPAQISPRGFSYLGVASLTPGCGETACAAFSLHTGNLDVVGHEADTRRQLHCLLLFGLGHLRVSIMNLSAKRPIHVETLRC